MPDFFTSWVRSLFKPKIPEHRSFKFGESLTPYELDQMFTKDDKYLACCDCEGLLVRGPSGGVSTNYMCDTCQAKFNLTLFPGGLEGERITAKAN